MVALEMRRNTTSVSLNKETSFSYGKLLHTRSLFTLSQFCDRPLLFSTLANLNSLKLTYAQVRLIKLSLLFREFIFFNEFIINRVRSIFVPRVIMFWRIKDGITS